MPVRYGICAGASTAALGRCCCRRSARADGLPWHCPQLPVMPVCRTELPPSVRSWRSRSAIAVWQTAQVWLPGFGMWPAGSAVLFQFAVVWQPRAVAGAAADAGGVIGRPALQRRR